MGRGVVVQTQAGKWGDCRPGPIENAPRTPQLKWMETTFDFRAPAEVFTAKRMGSRAQPVAYRRFDEAAEAVRYVIETLPADKLIATVLEAGDERYDGKAIRGLYDSLDYPLPRSMPTG